MTASVPARCDVDAGPVPNDDGVGLGQDLHALIDRLTISAGERRQTHEGCAQFVRALEACPGSTWQARWDHFEQAIWPRWMYSGPRRTRRGAVPTGHPHAHGATRHESAQPAPTTHGRRTRRDGERARALQGSHVALSRDVRDPRQPRLRHASSQADRPRPFLMLPGRAVPGDHHSRGRAACAWAHLHSVRHRARSRAATR